MAKTIAIGAAALLALTAAATAQISGDVVKIVTLRRAPRVKPIARA